MKLHPLPNFSAALAQPEPEERVRAVLRGFYAWYRETAPMAEKVQRDRGAVPALDALMERTADARLTQLTDALVAGFRGRGLRARRQRTLIRLALDFWTWRRLSGEVLNDNMAADLMNAGRLLCEAKALLDGVPDSEVSLTDWLTQATEATRID